MKTKIICIGKLKEKYLITGIEEFIKRLKVYTKLEIIELNEVKINDNPSLLQVEQVINQEGLNIIKQLDKKDFIIALDVKGKSINNLEYVSLIEKAQVNGYSSFTFIIGGSYGISEEVLSYANFKWSFSKLVFTHQMIRLLLVEQIYRGFRIMNNEPYHK